MKAPLIAVISVGIAAAAPAVAISANEPSSDQGRERSRAGTDPQQPDRAGDRSTKPTNARTYDTKRLVKRYLKLRNRANRLIAKRDGRRKPQRRAHARSRRWSNRGLGHAIRTLRKRIRHVRRDLRAPARRADARRAGGPRADRRLRVARQPARDRRRRRLPRQVPVHVRDLGQRGRQGRSGRRAGDRAGPACGDAAQNGSGSAPLACLRLRPARQGRLWTSRRRRGSGAALIALAGVPATRRRSGGERSRRP